MTSLDELPRGQDVSDTVIELAGWVVASGDSQGYPFAIMDKAAAQILVFGGDGRLRGAAPGLFGSAVGDHTAPGIAGLALREIPGRDRTTPAGRFVGGYGPSIDAGRVLWVDYESAVSIHPTATGVPEEKRPERLASPTPDDNRVTHGCINVCTDVGDSIHISAVKLPKGATSAITDRDFTIATIVAPSALKSSEGDNETPAGE
ncbi:TPA: hypothetical protein NIJ40_006698 [Pseudomonas aeruginosa]|nr:hypothetical protein [Pseudomonas aeruginosa]HCF7121417.1 hypothetical protein [Pseudomonas aeruginosa]